MPFKLTVMGISGDRVTFGIEASFLGQKIQYTQSTFSMEVGQQLNLIMAAKLERGGVIEDGEIIPTGGTLIDLPLLYKVESN